MFYVYVLRNDRGKHYVGSSKKPPHVRALEHNQGKSRWTRRKGPWRVLYHEVYETKREAVNREHQIKGYKGGRAFKALVEHN
jgi:putative endonuclease